MRVVVPISRRLAVGTLLTLGVGACGSPRPTTRAVATGRVGWRPRLIAFDGLVLFDPRPVVAAVQHMGGSADFVRIFRARLFEYQWLTALGGPYHDFVTLAQRALLFAGETAGVAVTRANLTELSHVLRHLQPWPDTAASLSQLKQMGLGTAVLSNMTPAMLSNGLEAANATRLVDHVFSTHDRRTFKPHRRAYSIAVDETGLTPNQVLFVAFAGWDACGAAWFGYPTFWVNRLRAAPERLDAHAPIGVTDDLSGFVEQLAAMPPS